MHITYIKHLLYRGTFCLGRNIKKNIMTSPRNMQEIMDGLKNNPYYDKYSRKIDQLKNVTPEKFSSRIKNCSLAKVKPTLTTTNESQFSKLLYPKKNIPSIMPEDESLNKIMKVDLVKDKNAEEIKAIWEQYHIEKHFIVATIPVIEYDKLHEKSTQFPTFLFPIPRSQGYEFIMCQFEQSKVHFTPLLYYQVHKENAPECLTMVHYTEFRDKGIVLMRGEYDKNIINVSEAQCLANQLKLYYTSSDPEKTKLLETFTHRPYEFKHADLISQIENLTL